MWRVNTLVVFFALCIAPVTAQQLGDPTAPPQRIQPSKSVEQSASMPSLQSIRWVNGQRTALIEGAWKQVGDTVGSYRVEVISMSDVVLRDTHNNKDITIRLFEFQALPTNPRAGSSL